MNVNLTLSVDEDILERARQVARHQGTSLNALVRDYLEQLAGKLRAEALANEIREMGKHPQGDSQGRKWNREAVYAERIDTLEQRRRR